MEQYTVRVIRLSRLDRGSWEGLARNVPQFVPDNGPCQAAERGAEAVGYRVWHPLAIVPL